MAPSFPRDDVRLFVLMQVQGVIEGNSKKNPRGNPEINPESSLYHKPRTFHQGKPTPIKMAMLTKEQIKPNFHQVFWSTYPELK